MDHQFLKFLGNYFIHSAKYQKQADDIMRWMNQGGSGFEEIASMFKKIYQIDGNASSDDFTMAFQKFQKSYMELFSVPGMVPEKKYQDLEKKYKKLKEKYDLQQETINNFSSMMTMKDAFQNNINQSIDHVMKNQKEIFENMLKSFKPKKP